ncbi:MAG: hypothetical protein IIB45_05940 [Candidatus Marinimicrobia bacterium]|nr:hypothetical protein [Candidatus Neomarinimicrobiota bacterium]
MKNILAIIVLISFVSNQEIGIIGSKSWTNNQDIENPLGFGLYIAQPLFQKLHVRLEFSRHTNQRKYIGTTYDGGPVGYNSKTELIKSYAYINSLELSFIYSVLESKYFNLKIGPGINTNSLDANKKGMETGRPVAVLGVDKFGLSLLINIVTNELKFVPLRLNCLYKRRYLGYIGATRVATDIENPFEDLIDISELQLGLSYSF